MDKQDGIATLSNLCNVDANVQSRVPRWIEATSWRPFLASASHEQENFNLIRTTSRLLA